MSFHVNTIAGVRYYCLLVVVLLHFVPEAAHAFAVTTFRRSSGIKSSLWAFLEELNIHQTGSKKNALYFKVGDIYGPSLLVPKLVRSQSQWHRARPIVFVRTAGGRGGREHITCSEHSFIDSYCRYEPSDESNYDEFGRIINKIEPGKGAGGGEFGWLGKFRNGKADIIGLVLSTILLMTAVAPAGAVANVAVAEQRFEKVPDAHQAKHYTIESANAPLFAVEGQDNRKRSVESKQVDPLQLGVMLHQGSVPVHIRKVRADFSGDSAKGEKDPLLSGTLAKMMRSTDNAVQSAIDSSKGIASWGANFGRRDIRLARNRPERAMSSFGFDATELGSPRELDKGSRVYHQRTLNAESRLSPRLEKDSAVSVAQHASVIEIEHVALFQESLPVPVLPESFNRALREMLPVLVPPAMALFLLVSMPVIVLLLKGIGTTLLAVVKYGNVERFPASAEAHAGSLELDLGGAPVAGGGGRHGERSLETPGLAFSLFTKRGGRVDGERLAVESSLEGHDQTKAKVRHDGHAQKRFFFDKKHPSAIRNGADQDWVGGDELRCGFGYVSDDAMAAMAMVTMTQELEHIKISLQNEVQIMRRELLQASNESKRLTEKLRCLQEENKKLGVVVSRLGGQDARRLKAELFSLLAATPSLEDLPVNGRRFEAQFELA